MRKNYCKNCLNFDGEDYCSFHEEYIRTIRGCEDFDEDCGPSPDEDEWDDEESLIEYRTNHD